MGQYSRVAGQSSRRASTGQQNRYVLVCVMKKRRSTARTPQNDLQQAIRVQVSDNIVGNRLYDCVTRS